MDPVTQSQSNIHGSHSGNQGNNSVFGSINSNTTMNIYMLSNVAGVEVGNQGGVFEAGDKASRPYRLIPYGRNRTFTGRTNLLESIMRVCERKGHNRVALHGLGGSGKTQIALEYVHQRISESDSDVFWVQGSGVLKFSEGFRAVSQRVRIPLPAAETDEEGVLRGIRRWFEGPNSGDWILVIDNADNEADFLANNSPLAKFIPQCEKGTLIFTTRSRQVASRQGCEMIQVGQMEEDEAHELFSKRFGSWSSLEEEEKKIVATILRSVHHLPLAIIGSAAFMTETTTPPSVYWAIFQENEERMKKLLSRRFSDIQREAGVTESILGTYFVTFDRIRQQMPMAADLLRLMAFLDRENIPEELLSESRLEGMNDAVDFCEAIGKLLGFSLATRVKCGDKTLYELHHLVQLSLQVYLPQGEANEGKAAALKVVSRLFPRSRNEQRRIGPTYIPHALAVTKDTTDPITEELGFHMGEYFLEIGSYDTAEIQLRRCIALRTPKGKAYPCDDQGLLRLVALARVNGCQGKYKESERMSRRLLVGCEKNLGPDHFHTLGIVSNLGIVLRDQGKYDESETMCRRALEGREKICGPDHPETLKSVHNLAAVLQRQGRYDESETLDRRAREGGEKLFGSDHPSTLVSLNNRAAALGRQGKYQESEAMNRCALDGLEKVLGLDHPDTLRCVNNRAVVLKDQGKYDESEAVARRALESYEKILGPDHPDTLISVNNLASVLQCQGKYKESEAMNRRALEGYERVLGPDHHNTLTSVNDLAALMQRQGKYVESETMYRRALGGYQKVLGPDHPDTLTAIDNLSAVLRLQRKYDESETMNWRSLAGRETLHGPNHPFTLSTLNHLALVLRDQKKYHESETMTRRALDRREKALGPDHPDTLRTVGDLATVLREQGMYNESEMLYRRELEGREKVLGPDDLSAVMAVTNLIAVLLDQRKHHELEPVIRRAVEVYKKVLGRDDPHTLEMANRLAMLQLG